MVRDSQLLIADPDSSSDMAYASQFCEVRVAVSAPCAAQFWLPVLPVPFPRFPLSFASSFLRCDCVCPSPSMHSCPHSPHPTKTFTHVAPALLLVVAPLHVAFLIPAHHSFSGP